MWLTFFILGLVLIYIKQPVLGVGSILVSVYSLPKRKKKPPAELKPPKYVEPKESQLPTIVIPSGAEGARHAQHAAGHVWGESMIHSKNWFKEMFSHDDYIPPQQAISILQDLRQRIRIFQEDIRDKENEIKELKEKVKKIEEEGKEYMTTLMKLEKKKLEGEIKKKEKIMKKTQDHVNEMAKKMLEYEKKVYKKFKDVDLELPKDKEKKSSCFIATAAYGSPMEPEVQSLRRFRDMYLESDPIGKILVRTYYITSPPIANYIREREKARKIVRKALKPIVEVAKRIT